MLKKFLMAMAVTGILMTGQIASPATAEAETFEFQPIAKVSVCRAQAYWGVVVNCNEWITLRARPSTSAATVTRIPLGARVMIYDGPPQNGFYEAEYQGMHGYVLASYIRSTNEAA